MQQEMAEFVGDVKTATKKSAFGSSETNEWPLGYACGECVNIAYS